MKKTVLALTLATCLGFATAGNTSTIKGYSSTQHPPHSVNTNELLHAPTNITVINASNNYIYVSVPNSPVNDYLRPMINDHIYNYDPNVFSTYLVLRDPYNQIFYAATICRLAIVTVHGYSGNYMVNTDSDLCR